MARNFPSDSKLSFVLEVIRREKPACEILNPSDQPSTDAAYKEKLLRAEPKFLLRCGHPPVAYTQVECRTTTLSDAGTLLFFLLFFFFVFFLSFLFSALFQPINRSRLGLVPRGIIYVDKQ
jgi:hypothetical protein